MKSVFLIALLALCILFLGAVFIASFDENSNGIPDPQEYKVHYQEE